MPIPHPDPNPKPISETKSPFAPAPASAPAAGKRPTALEDLLSIMARLRAPDGCPWDLKQTHSSILNNLIEEAYEFVDAVEAGDIPNMQEELGDLLLQVVFHAQMAKEAGAFDFEDIAKGIGEKLVRRHPHVFGDAKVEGAEGVQKQWDAIKKKEKEGQEGPGEKPAEENSLGQIPKHLPALLKAEKLQKRAAGSGFDWPDWKGPWQKVHEELAEFKAETQGGDPDRLESEFGDILFSLVNLGRFFKIDPEKALGRANRKFTSRYAAMETLARQQRGSLEKLTLEEMDAFWNQVKAGEI